MHSSRPRHTQIGLFCKRALSNRRYSGYLWLTYLMHSSIIYIHVCVCLYHIYSSIHSCITAMQALGVYTDLSYTPISTRIYTLIYTLIYHIHSSIIYTHRPHIIIMCVCVSITYTRLSYTLIYTRLYTLIYTLIYFRALFQKSPIKETIPSSYTSIYHIHSPFRYEVV